MKGHVAVRSLLSASDNPWQVEEPKAEGIAAMESDLTEKLGVVMETIERDSRDVLDVEVSGTESVLRDLCLCLISVAAIQCLSQRRHVQFL